MAAFVARSSVRGMDNSPGWGATVTGHGGLGGKCQRQSRYLHAHSLCTCDLRVWLDGYIHLVGIGIPTAPQCTYLRAVIHAYVSVCLSDCASVCVCVFQAVHMDVQMYISACVYMWIDTQAHRYLDSRRCRVCRCVHTSDREDTLLSKKTDTM